MQSEFTDYIVPFRVKTNKLQKPKQTLFDVLLTIFAILAPQKHC